MYCYGSAFHVNKLRLKRVVCANTPEVVSGGHIERVSTLKIPSSNYIAHSIATEQVYTNAESYKLLIHFIHVLLKNEIIIQRILTPEIDTKLCSLLYPKYAKL